MYPLPPRHSQLLNLGLALATLVSLGPVCLHAQTGKSTSAADRSIQTISSALRGGDNALALSEARSALRTVPSDVRLWTLGALAAIGEHDPATGLKFLKDAVRLQPRYLPAQKALGQLLFQTSNPEAESVLQTVVGLDSHDPVAHAMLGDLAYRRHDCPVVIRESRLAGEAVQNNAAALSNFGTCLASEKDSAGAETALRRSLKLAPGEGATRYNLALLLQEQDRPREVLLLLEPALAVPRPGGDVLTLAAEVADALGDKQRAVDLLRRKIELAPRDDAAYIELAALCYKYQPKLGITAIDFGLSQLPDSARLHLVRGILYGELGNVTQSSADLEKAQALDAQLGFLELAKGLSSQQGHNSEAAEPRFRRAVQNAPNDPLPRLLLALTLSQLAPTPEDPRNVEARREAAAAVRLSPSWADAHVLLAKLDLNAGLLAEGAAEAEAALKLEPENQQALFQLILAKRKSGDKAALSKLVQRLSALKATGVEAAYKPPPAP